MHMSAGDLQSKLRIEMGHEKIRQQLAKEMDEKEQEMEEMKASTMKKVHGRWHVL